MIYDIRHVTTYEYESPVSFARCTLRLEPGSGHGQELISHKVEIRPRPAERSVRRDFFGTLTESVVIEAAHRTLRIDSRSRVKVSRQPPARDAAIPAWASDCSMIRGRTRSAGRSWLILPTMKNQAHQNLGQLCWCS